jgi:hypothetical protein
MLSYDANSDGKVTREGSNEVSGASAGRRYNGDGILDRAEVKRMTGAIAAAATGFAVDRLVGTAKWFSPIRDYGPLRVRGNGQEPRWRSPRPRASGAADPGPAPGRIQTLSVVLEGCRN